MTKLQEMWSYINKHTQTTINYGMIVKLLDAVELEAAELIAEHGAECAREADRRAEAAEARAAMLEAERDEARVQLEQAQQQIDDAVAAERGECARRLVELADDGERTVAIMTELGYPTSKSVAAEALRIGAAAIRARSGSK